MIALRLAYLYPCPPAIAWLGRRRSPERAWRECPHGDWMLWLLAKAGIRPPLDWVAREIVAHAFGHASDVLDVAGISHDLRHHEAALRAATAETVTAVLAAAWATGAAWTATGAAEHRRCACAVRRLYPTPPPEVLALLRVPADAPEER